MFALVYASRESQPFDHAQLVELSRRADQKNKRLRITGYLNYRRGAFFQYLEGAEAHVLELMEIIAADARHQVMHMLPLGEHAERRFSDWSMRYVSGQEMTQISLEDVLEGVLATMLRPQFDAGSAQQTVLRLVERISAVRGRLPLLAV